MACPIIDWIQSNVRYLLVITLMFQQPATLRTLRLVQARNPPHRFSPMTSREDCKGPRITGPDPFQRRCNPSNTASTNASMNASDIAALSYGTSKRW